MDAAATSPLAPDIVSIGAIDIVSPPAFTIDLSDWSAPANGVYRDYLLRAEQNAAIGLAGELATVAFEEARLSELGLRNLARKVEHVSKTKGDGLGYDIRSFNPDGSDRLIEVKTTRYAAEMPFFVTQTEVKVSEVKADSYHLYRLYNFSRRTKLYSLHGALSLNCALEPSNYLAAPRKA
jgi:hypothetical protein